jgi:hypothetical protein
VRKRDRNGAAVRRGRAFRRADRHQLTKALVESGVRILGTPADSIDAAEDRERFDALLGAGFASNVARGRTVKTEEQALSPQRGSWDTRVDPPISTCSAART